MKPLDFLELCYNDFLSYIIRYVCVGGFSILRIIETRENLKSSKGLSSYHEHHHTFSCSL